LLRVAQDNGTGTLVPCFWVCTHMFTNSIWFQWSGCGFYASTSRLFP